MELTVRAAMATAMWRFHDAAMERAIERPEKYNPGIIASVQSLKVYYGCTELKLSEFENPNKIPLTQESFWWVLGRIIHSKETHVVYRTVDIVVTSEATGCHYSIMQPVAFGFSSDRDSTRIDHFVELEAFVLPYLSGIAHRIEEAIRARNNPA